MDVIFGYSIFHTTLANNNAAAWITATLFTVWKRQQKSVIQIEYPLLSIWMGLKWLVIYWVTQRPKVGFVLKRPCLPLPDLTTINFSHDVSCSELIQLSYFCGQDLPEIIAQKRKYLGAWIYHIKSVHKTSKPFIFFHGSSCKKRSEQ